MKQTVYSVGQVNSYIKNMFAQDFMLNRVSVKGEVSNCKYHTTGHIYFTLKDETGTMACVMFAGQRKGLAFRMQEGQQVLVSGSVSVYERDGRYQLYAKEIQLDGAGDLYRRFEELKQELMDMGMFANEYKQRIPAFIKTLGIVTAPAGAAVRDIINIAHRRNPYIQIILYPALVQGEGAAESIVRGIKALDAAGVDVMIVGRGGGSIEDLWAFNEEAVARAIFDCETPVISAVGHETDTTIADYTADLRAPTPSAAAELAVFEYAAFEEQLKGYEHRFRHLFQSRLEQKRAFLSQYSMRLSLSSPKNQIREKQQQLMEFENRLLSGMKVQLSEKQHMLQLYIEKFHGLSPLRKLGQGFAYVEINGRALTDIECVEIGDTIEVHVLNGDVKAVVEQKQSMEREG